MTGYVVYFSDRRTNRDAANLETGEYGFEDFVNPASVNGLPNGFLDTAEDVNGNGTLDTYGQNPIKPIWWPLDAPPVPGPQSPPILRGETSRSSSGAR